MAGLVAVPAQAGAATDVVTNCDGSAATVGSLPHVVASAASGDTITFSVNCPRSSPIKLAAAVNIGVNLIIDGPGAGKLAVSGRSAGRVFTIGAGVTATISGLTIEHGKTSGLGAGIRNAGNLTLTDTTVTSNTSLRGGGGIYTSGPLTISNSTISDNKACQAQCSNPSGDGGGIDDLRSPLSITGSTFSGNRAAYGAGLESDVGGLTLKSSTLTGNIASVEGGGLFDRYGTITGSTVSGNSAGHWGGGIAGDGVTVTGSTLSDNNAPNGAGFWGAGLALVNSVATGNAASADGGMFGGDSVTVTGSTLSGNSAGLGGAIWVQDGGMDVTDSTLASNTATGQGGAIYYQPATASQVATVSHTTIWGNTAPPGGGGGVFLNTASASAPVSLAATIVANSGPGLDCASTSGPPVTDGGYNLADDNSCGLGGTSLSDTPAGLDPAGPQDNGGPTPTIALEPGSPAIGLVTAAALCTGNDQRGAPWPTPCDSGAIQSGEPVR